MRHDSLRRTFALLAVAFAADAPAAQLDLVPDALVGKNSFSEVVTSASATQLAVPGGIAEDPRTGELWVSDSAHRVLRFSSAAAYSAGQPANLVLGQADFTSSQPNRGGVAAANTLRDPRGVAVNQLGHVYVADSSNHRVLIFRPPFTNGMNANFVMGQPDFAQSAASLALSSPQGLALDAEGQLLVADAGNGRITIFFAPHENDPAGGASRITGGEPTSVAVDAAGNIWVTDPVTNRVLRLPRSSGPPERVLCQPDFVAALSGSTLDRCAFPFAVALDPQGAVYVADGFNGRVLRYPPDPANGAAATQVVTGTGFGCDAVLPSSAPCFPRALLVDRRGNLHMGDNHARVMRYDLPSSRLAPSLSSLGPSTVPVGTAFTLTVNGDGFDAGAVVTWDGQPRTTRFVSSKRVLADIPAGDPAGVFAYGVAVVNPGPGGGSSNTLTFTPYVRGNFDGLADRFLLSPGFDDLDETRIGAAVVSPIDEYSVLRVQGVPGSVAIEPGSGRLFMSDADASRILSWPNAASFRNADPADVILGKPDGFSGGCNRRYTPGVPEATTLCNPTQMAFDANGALYVADTSNRRALKYVPPFTTGMAPSLVFGQGGSFTTNTFNKGPDPAGHMSTPAAVAVHGGALWIHDGVNRVVRRYSDPDHVQLSDLSIGITTNPCPPATFCFPQTQQGAMTFDGAGRLYIVVGDTVRRFSPPFSADSQPDLVLGDPAGPGSTATTLRSPRGLAVDPSGALLVADYLNGRILRFEPPLTSGMPASQVLGQPDFVTVNGTPSRSRLNQALSVAVGAAGAVYALDTSRLLAFDTPFAPAGSGADFDNDGIPNGLEASEGRDPWTKDNDVFTNARLFAMQQYRDFLSREGDATGVSFWSGAVGNGSIGRSAMIESFFNSGEFQGTISPVTRLYFAYFLRIPDYAGLQFWIGYYKAGNTLASVSQNFALSPEFTSRYGALNNSQFVDLVYQNVLGRAPDAGGKAFWQGQLDSNAQTRGQVMVGFSESDEYKLASFNKVYVTMMYIGMLRRSPDPGGFDFWVNYKNAGNSGLALIDGFLVSQEYRSRFLP